MRRDAGCGLTGRLPLGHQHRWVALARGIAPFNEHRPCQTAEMPVQQEQAQIIIRIVILDDAQRAANRLDVSGVTLQPLVGRLDIIERVIASPVQ